MTFRTAARPLLSAACYASFVAQVALAAESGSLRTVGITGQTAPGAGGALFNTFTLTPTLNELGQVAFAASLQLEGPGQVSSSDDTGVWSEGSGALALVVREDSTTPGTASGVKFSTFSAPIINDQGEVGFQSLLRGVGVTPSNDGTVWSELTGSLGLVDRDGSQAAGTPAGAVFNSLNNVRFSEDRIAFSGRLVSGTPDVSGASDSGIWRSDGAVSELIAREGSPAPDTPAGAVFSDFDGVSPVMGGGGHIAFRGLLRTNVGEVTAADDVGVWSTGAGPLGLVAREGRQAPGSAAGANFADFGFNAPSINSMGRVAFPGTLTGGGVTQLTDSGYWSQGGDGVLKLIAREGSSAPGVPGVNFAHMTGPIVINEPGQTVFLGSLQLGVDITSANDQGVWVERDGELTLFAREGTQAPGVTTGGNFVFSARQFPALALNDAGRIAMHAFLSGSGITSANDSGIWAEDLTGVLRLLVREGDVLEVAPGDLRTINGLVLRSGNGITSDQGSGFNDAGQVAFVANFVGGTSGVFVSNLATLPEPHALALVVFGAVWGAAVCRRGRISRGVPAGR